MIKDLIFAITMGGVTAWSLIAMKDLLFNAGVKSNQFLTALLIVLTIIAWKILFGPWKPRVRALTLLVFILAVAAEILIGETQHERLAHYLSIVVALIPACVWVALFLEYHVERFSLVALMFLSGVLSTAPILFYDALVRRGVQFQFFVLRVVPENFNRVSHSFVTNQLDPGSGVRITLFSALVSFLLVGLIEEVSKFWVLKTSGRRYFSSIDDVVLLSIIVAIGFAFAENVLNPLYFLSFVKNQLITPTDPAWGSFIGNVLGRSVLTNMVHILSSGVLGYFFGLSVFARPYLEEGHRKGKSHLILHTLHKLLRYPEKDLFRKEVLIIGFVVSIALHGLFNFLVTLPEILPGNPSSLGDLFGLSGHSFLHSISLLLIPSLFYVVGGFWLLSALLLRKENKKERGERLVTDTFVLAQ